MEGGRITWILDADTSSFNSSMASAEGTAKRTAQSMNAEFDKSQRDIERTFNRLGDNLQQAGRSMTLFVTAPVVAGFGLAVKAASDFENTMSQLRIVSGATGVQMTALSEKAQELGRDVNLAGVTAADAAAAMIELSKAGIDVNDTLGASRAVLQLAKAGQLDFGAAANFTAAAMNAFKIKGEDAIRVADTLANGANASQASLHDLALGMQQSSSIASLFGLTLEENVTALSLFANNGIRASDAGTSLKSMLLAIATPSKQAAEQMKEMGFSAYDAQGNFVGLGEISKRLQNSLKGMNDQQRQTALGIIFGSDAIRSASLLAQNAGENWDEMSEKISRSGTAAEVAAAMYGPFRKALEGLLNNLSQTGLDIGAILLPPLTDLLKSLTGLVQAFNSLDGPVKNVAIGLGLVAASIGPTLLGLGLMLKTGRFMRETYQDLAKVMTLFKATAVGSATTTAAAWVAAPFKIAAAWTAAKVKVVGSFMAMQAASAASAAKTGAIWVAQAALTAARFVPVLTSITAGFIQLGVQALLTGARMAAAWLLALGPIGIAIAVIGTIAALIIANWDKVKGFILPVFKAIGDAAVGFVEGVVKVFNNVVSFFKEWGPTILAVMFWPFALVLGLIFTHKEAIIKILTDLGKTIGDIFNGIATFFTNVWNGIVTAAKIIWDGLVAYFQFWITVYSAIFTGIVTFFTNLWTGVVTVTTTIWNGIVTFFTEIWLKIVEIFTPVVEWFAQVFSDAWTGITAIWDGVVGYFQGIWDGIVDIYNVVATFFGGVFKGAWDGIVKAFNGVVGFFRGIWDQIVKIFQSVGSAIGNAVVGTVKNAINGVLTFAVNAINTFIGAINGAIDIINAIPGVKIPKIGKLGIPRLAEGGIALPRPGGMLAQIAEGGQAEAVIPLTKLNRMMREVSFDTARKFELETAEKAYVIENHIGEINIANDVDGEDWLKRLTRDDEITQTGLTS